MPNGRAQARPKPRRRPRRTLFVYGTLLRGETNDHRLAGAEPLGPALTVAGYDLLDLGGYPALVAGGATAVAGELYALAAPALARLDAFEGHPTLFCRTRIRLSTGRTADAYLFDRRRAERAPLIPSGDWRRREG